MSERDWKEAERCVAELLGGHRVLISSRTRGDVHHGERKALTIGVKSRRRRLPDRLEEAVHLAKPPLLTRALIHGQFAYFSHHHTLIIDADPDREGRYIPLEDFGRSRELVEVYRAFPAAAHIDRFFGETAAEPERDFKEGRAAYNHGTLRISAHFFEVANR